MKKENVLRAVAMNKMVEFIIKPVKENLLNMEEYMSLTPFSRGYANYLQSAWEESPIPEDESPYPEESVEHELFKKGSFACMMEMVEIGD